MSNVQGKNVNLKMSYDDANYFNLPFVPTFDLKESTSVVDGLASISQNPNPTQPINGNKTVDGSVSSIFDTKIMPYFLIGVMGTHYRASNGEDVPSFTHTFKMNKNMPKITILKEIMDTGEFFKYADAKIGSFGISISGESDVTVNYNLMSVVEEKNTTETSATNVSEGDKFQYSNTSINIDGSSVNCNHIESFSFDLNRNLDGSYFGLCGGKRAGVYEGAKGTYDSKMSMFYTGSLNDTTGNGHNLEFKIISDNNPSYFKIKHTANVQPQGVAIDTPLGLKQDVEMKGYEDLTIYIGDTADDFIVDTVSTLLPTAKTLDGSSDNAGEITINGDLLNLGDSNTVAEKFEYRLKGTTDWTITAPTTVSATGTYTETITGLTTDDIYEVRTAVSDSVNVDFSAYGSTKEIVVS